MLTGRGNHEQYKDQQIMKKIIKQFIRCGILLVLFVCVSSVNIYADSGSVPIYLYQEATETEEPDADTDADTNKGANSPITYDGYIKIFVTLLVICMAGFIASTCAARKSQKDSNEK